MAEGSLRAPFPETRKSVLQRIASADPETRRRARNDLAQLYWSPIYTYLRLRFGLERDHAADATQEFFARELARDLFARYDPTKAKFRTYVRLCVDSFLANEYQAEQRLKRGGGAQHVDINDAELVIASSGTLEDADALFEREWMRALFAQSLTTFRRQCDDAEKQTQFAVFVRYDVEPTDGRPAPTYGELATEFGLPVTQVTNYLHWSRRQFRAVVLEALRSQCVSDDQYRAEAQAIFGARV